MSTSLDVPISFWPGVVEELQSLGVRHIDQYVGAWAMHEPALLASVASIERLNLVAHIASQQADPSRIRSQMSRTPRQEKNIARIEIEGTMMKHASSLAGCSTKAVASQLRAAARDPDIAGIFVRIDSPGGTAAGTKELADELAAAAAAKPTHVFIEDLGASAAYWVASQAGRITANATAFVGSIGTFAVINDLSSRAAMEGIKVHVIRAGEMKGAGTPGTEITAEQLAEWQRVVDQLNEHFLAGVAQGRQLPAARVTQLADGRVHMAGQAVELGLIDAVSTIDQAFQDLLTEVEKTTMSETNTQRPASAADITACCPGSEQNSAWVLAQLNAGATIDQAQSAWMELQQRVIAQLQQELTDARAAAKRPGVAPLASKPPRAKSAEGSDEEETDDEESEDEDEDEAVAAWNSAIEAKVAKGMSRAAAVRAVNRARPELREAYLAAVNARRRRRA